MLYGCIDDNSKNDINKEDYDVFIGSWNPKFYTNSNPRINTNVFYTFYADGMVKHWGTSIESESYEEWGKWSLEDGLMYINFGANDCAPYYIVNDNLIVIGTEEYKYLEYHRCDLH
jgi:hypothetical protein